jgi:hypothetical protein
LTVTKAGLFDCLLIGGGGGGADEGASRAAGGGAGGFIEGQVYLTTNQTVVVGAGGAARTQAFESALQNGASLAVSIVALGGGAGINSSNGTAEGWWVGWRWCY